MYTINYEECKKYLELSLQSTPSAPETINPPACVDSAGMHLLNKGQLCEKVCCTFHKYFEWELDREFFDFSQYLDVTSPVFQVDHQSFYLEMTPKCRYTFRLYRVGPSVKDAIYACRASLINYYGLGQAPSYDDRLDLSEELAEWTDVQQLFTVSSSYLYNSCFRHIGKVTFFIRFNIIRMNFEKKIPILREPCNQGTLRTTPTTIGCIVDKEWKMYKKVQWDIPCKSITDCQDNSGPSELSLNELLSPKMVFHSPVFRITSQTYYLSAEISRDSSTSHIIRLYRLGPSVDMSVRLWIQVKNGSNCVFASRNMDLSKACIDWTYGERLISFEEISESSFSVEFLMSKVDTLCGVIQSIDEGDSPLELDPARTEFLSFRAYCMDFTVHRSLLTMRVPLFEAMLSHDTAESQTGLLYVDDFHPVVIAMFLHYVDTGNGPLWTDKYSTLIIDYTAGLFAVADKYLVTELRDMCLTFLDQIELKENELYNLAVKRNVDKFKDIFSTFPSGLLKKWPTIEFYHTCSDNN